jgi:SPP1 gp7 family putative phage head morphogenesis protein
MMAMVIVTMAKNKIDPEYKKTIEQIRIDSENNADNQMQDIYKLQNDKLDEVHAMAGMIFIKYAKNGLLNVTGKAKSNMINTANKKLTGIGKDLGTAEVSKVSNIISNTYKDTYYKNAYVMDKFGVNPNFSTLKQKYVNSVINAKYKGSDFSDRIWKNKSAVIDKLGQTLLDANDGATTIDQLGQAIQDIFGVQAYESRRLVRTEVARNATSAQLQIGLDSGCQTVLWSATLDDRTAEYDASLDGQSWGINDDHPVPVDDTHPNCRCVLINVPYDGWQPSQRMDNETGDLIDYQDYATWAQTNGIDNDDDENEDD